MGKYVGLVDGSDDDVKDGPVRIVPNMCEERSIVKRARRREDPTRQQKGHDMLR